MLVGEARFSFLNCFNPKLSKDKKRMLYSACVMIPKTNVAMVTAINEAVEAAKLKGLEDGKITKAHIPRLKLPLRDGDEEYQKQLKGKEFAGHFFFNANNEDPPGILKLEGRAKVPILEPKDFYSGCYGWAEVSFYPFNNVSVGVGVGLNHLMMTKPGERLDGRVSLDDAFADLDISVDDDESGAAFEG